MRAVCQREALRERRGLSERLLQLRWAVRDADMQRRRTERNGDGRRLRWRELPGLRGREALSCEQRLRQRLLQLGRGVRNGNV
jgi:hypothetical protein